MRIIIAGPKCSGKSAVGRLAAEELDIAFIETDAAVESIYKEENQESLACREIYNKHGEKFFRNLEKRAVEKVDESDWCVISTGGSTLLDPDSRRILRNNSLLVLLTASPEVLWQRMEKLGLPKFYSEPDGKDRFFARLDLMSDVLMPYADILFDTNNYSSEEAAQVLLSRLEEEIEIRQASPNTLGRIIRITTFGESHGPAVGAVLDGVPPGVALDESDIQKQLDRRKPGQSSVTTPRKEPDKVRILSGVFEGKTTGAPIGLLIENTSQISRHYDNIKDIFRPGHADYTFWAKFGRRDYRGGGRSSGRETAARVAGGAVARKVLEDRGVRITAYALEIAGVRAEEVDYDFIEQNPVRAADSEAAEKMAKAVAEARERRDSVGGIVQLEIEGVPPGLGDPVFGKLDARLGGAILSLGAVKGVEFGVGFAAARMYGSEHNDEMWDGRFLTNNAGGVLGGISTGQVIVVRAAVKPTPSISIEQNAADTEGENRRVSIKGRHDPCIVPRVIPVIESMAALVILDMWEIQSKLRPGWLEENKALIEPAD